MIYKGRVKNGVVILEGPTAPADGTPVNVHTLKGPRAAERDRAKPLSLYDRLKPVIGIASGLPRDLARNHDHYLHGRPKK